MKKGKHRNVVVTAIVREMIAYIWAISREVVITPIDPQETTNLISEQLSAEHKAIIHRFEQIILAKMQTTNDPVLPLL